MPVGVGTEGEGEGLRRGQNRWSAGLADPWAGRSAVHTAYPEFVYLMISFSCSSSRFWRIMTDSMICRSSGVRCDRSGMAAMLSGLCGPSASPGPGPGPGRPGRPGPGRPPWGPGHSPSPDAAGRRATASRCLRRLAVRTAQRASSAKRPRPPTTRTRPGARPPHGRRRQRRDSTGPRPRAWRAWGASAAGLASHSTTSRARRGHAKGARSTDSRTRRTPRTRTRRATASTAS